jgi:hypothetical protein
MADQSKRAANASLAVGAGAGLAAVNTNRIANKRNEMYQRNIDRKLSELKNGKFGLDATGKPVDKVKAPAKGEYNPKRKIERQYENRMAGKRKGARIVELGEKRKNVPWTPATRGKFMRGSLVVAVPATVIGSRYSVNKSDVRRKDVDLGLAAAGGAGIAYQAGGYALKPVERRLERQLSEEYAGRKKSKGKDTASRVVFGDKKTGPEGRAILNEHKKKSNLPKGAPVAGTKEWRNYFKTYPTNLPGGRMKRVLARTHAGPSGAAATAGVASIAGIAAANASRQKEKSNVSKGTNIREYPYLPENIREWREGYYPIRRNPISPVESLSAGILMARANAAGYGQKLSRRQAKKSGKNNVQFFDSRRMIYSPVGRGSAQ